MYQEEETTKIFDSILPDQNENSDSSLSESKEIIEFENQPTLSKPKERRQRLAKAFETHDETKNEQRQIDEEKEKKRQAQSSYEFDIVCELLKKQFI